MSGPLALLPPNAGLFEKAVAAAMDDGGLPVPIRDVVNPARTPVAFLPFLAAHESVDLWYPDWSEARKRTVIANAIMDAWLKGTRDGARQYLSYVDGTLVDAVSYPARFTMGFSIIGRTPIGHPKFTANYLVRVDTVAPKRAFIIGRSAIGRSFLMTPDNTKRDRALAALRVAKAPETQIRVDFQHARQIRINDGVPLDGTFRLGQWVERTKL